MTSISLRSPDSLHITVKDLVKREGVSMNQCITLGFAPR